MCLVGANFGCKTRLVRPHVVDEFDDRYITTLGTKVSKKAVRLDALSTGNRVIVDLTVWDIMGKAGFRELATETYFHGTKGILAVADMTRRQTLNDLGDWIEGVESVVGPVPVAVIAANHDRKEDLQFTAAEIASVARKHRAPCFFETRTSGAPVEAAFRYLAEAALGAGWASPLTRDP